MAVDWPSAPASGRRETLLDALRLLHELEPGALIVEIGTARNPSQAALEGDGWATRIFGWYAERTGGRVISIDPSRRAIRNAQTICRDWRSVIDFRCERAESVAPKLGHIGLLYMDGPSRTDVHMDVWRKLRYRPRLVLIDDVSSWPPAEDWTGGTWLTEMIATLLDAGYRAVFVAARQMLLRRD